MLFRLNLLSNEFLPEKRCYLRDFGWDERKFQSLLFSNLERVLQEEDFLLIMQSAQWQEEPDLMAIDKKGDLYIFELKAWESRSENILQVLRYGQIFGGYDYDQLNDLFVRRVDTYDKNLIETANQKFGTSLKPEDINQKQHFIVLTNGVDHSTREAIQYWASQGLCIRSWIYRLYMDNQDVLVEFGPFSQLDDPYEDVEGGYFILNTNYTNDPSCQTDMLKENKAAAYYAPWKNKIKSIQPKDKVFLYQSGVGIVAKGIAKGKFKTKEYKGQKDEEFYMELDQFKILNNPISAAEIKILTGNNFIFRQTMFSIDELSGGTLWNYISNP